MDYLIIITFIFLLASVAYLFYDANQALLSIIAFLQSAMWIVYGVVAAVRRTRE